LITVTTTIGDQLARLGGADLDVLRQAPTARGRFIQFGIVLLCTAGLAVVSMTFALVDGLRAPVPIALLCGLGWGFLILNLDRLLIQSMDLRGSIGRTLLMVAPRIAMAALLGIVISTPLVLRVFHSEIEANTVLINAERQEDLAGSLERSGPAQELQKVEADIARNEGVLAGDIEVSAPQVTTAQADLDRAEAALAEKRKVSDALFTRMQCEQSGENCAGGSGRAGSGPLFESLQREYRTALADTNAAQARADRARQAVEQAEAASRGQQADTVAKARAEAERVLPGLRERRAELEEIVDGRTRDDTEKIVADVGLLSQIRALHDLGEQSSAARAAHWALGALFFMIELLPVLVKTMTGFGARSAYDRMHDAGENSLGDRAKIERTEARRRLTAESDMRRRIDDDRLVREQNLGIKANEYVEKEMEKILDRALAQWGQQLATTVGGTSPGGPVPGNGAPHPPPAGPAPLNDAPHAIPPAGPPPQAAPPRAVPQQAAPAAPAPAAVPPRAPALRTPSSPVPQAVPAEPAAADPQRVIDLTAPDPGAKQRIVRSNFHLPTGDDL
jgi:hypothetical protein